MFGKPARWTRVGSFGLAKTTLLTKVNQPSQEDLLGYVLGALDADQQQALQKLIDEDPQIEERMLEIRSSINPLELLDEPCGMRPGLARRTCEMVANYQNDVAQQKNEFREPLVSGSSWSAQDFLVAAASIAILAAILIPILDQSRYQAQIAKCQGNLVSLGTSLASYDDAHGHLPPISPGDTHEPYMAYMLSVLRDTKFLEDDNQVACAAVRRNEPICIPSCNEIRHCEAGPDFNRIRTRSCGDYAFSFGHFDSNKTYHPPSVGEYPHRVLIADKPSVRWIGGPSDNHRGNGQNVLWQDLSTRFIKGNSVADDGIYTNDYNSVAPGVGAHDSVIGPSHLSPFGISDIDQASGQYLE